MPNTTTEAVAGDTAILASEQDPREASKKLQHHLNEMELWLRTCGIKISAAKFIHVVFTTRECTRPPVKLSNEILRREKCGGRLEKSRN